MGLMSFFSSILSGPEKIRPVSGSIYDFKTNDLSGNEIEFSRYKGKALLIVNTASKCGFTPQYAALETLHEKYGDKVAVLGFPANNFLWQEPLADREIASFCQQNYGVNFQMFGKISVKGSNQHPLYRWLAAKTGKTPSWNFCKYFVSKDGKEIKFYPSKINPLDADIVNEIIKPALSL
jgi:glutathione peroxidase